MALAIRCTLHHLIRQLHMVHPFLPTQITGTIIRSIIGWRCLDQTILIKLTVDLQTLLL